MLKEKLLHADTIKRDLEGRVERVEIFIREKG